MLFVYIAVLIGGLFGLCKCDFLDIELSFSAGKPSEKSTESESAQANSAEWIKISNGPFKIQLRKMAEVMPEQRFDLVHTRLDIEKTGPLALAIALDSEPSLLPAWLTVCERMSLNHLRIIASTPSPMIRVVLMSMECFEAFLTKSYQDGAPDEEQKDISSELVNLPHLTLPTFANWLQWNSTALLIDRSIPDPDRYDNLYPPTQIGLRARTAKHLQLEPLRDEDWSGLTWEFWTPIQFVRALVSTNSTDALDIISNTHDVSSSLEAMVDGWRRMFRLQQISGFLVRLLSDPIHDRWELSTIEEEQIKYVLRKTISLRMKVLRHFDPSIGFDPEFEATTNLAPLVRGGFVGQGKHFLQDGLRSPILPLRIAKTAVGYEAVIEDIAAVDSLLRLAPHHNPLRWRIEYIECLLGTVPAPILSEHLKSVLQSEGGSPQASYVRYFMMAAYDAGQMEVCQPLWEAIPAQEDRIMLLLDLPCSLPFWQDIASSDLAKVLRRKLILKAYRDMPCTFQCNSTESAIDFISNGPHKLLSVNFQLLANGETVENGNVAAWLHEVQQDVLMPHVRDGVFTPPLQQTSGTLVAVHLAIALKLLQLGMANPVKLDATWLEMVVGLHPEGSERFLETVRRLDKDDAVKKLDSGELRVLYEVLEAQTSRIRAFLQHAIQVASIPIKQLSSFV